MGSRKQLIAIDGSDQAQNAFDWYLENLYKEGDMVLLAHCAEYNINIVMPGTHNVEVINEMCEAMKKKNDEISTLTDGFMTALRDRKIKSKVLLLSGKPGEAIVKAAQDESATHIIMGTRGMSRVRRTFIGSVSDYVLHHAECAVSIIRKPGDA